MDRASNSEAGLVQASQSLAAARERQRGLHALVHGEQVPPHTQVQPFRCALSEPRASNVKMSVPPSSDVSLPPVRFSMPVKLVMPFAEPLLARVSYVSPSVIAQVHAGLGHVAQALAALRAACDLRASDLAWLDVRPSFRSLRREPAYAALVERVGVRRALGHES